MAITTVESGPRKVSRSALVGASAEEIFALIADPHRHAELDGSGTVRATVRGPQRLTQGATFSVNMKQFGAPYRITSRVTELVEDRVVEWQHPAGHRWRWELVPVSDIATTVTETFDYSTIPSLQAKALELFGFPQRNARGIEATLRLLQERAAV